MYLWLGSVPRKIVPNFPPLLFWLYGSKLLPLVSSLPTPADFLENIGEKMEKVDDIVLVVSLMESHLLVGGSVQSVL